MDGAGGRHGRREMRIRGFWYGNMGVKGDLEDLGIDGC